MPLHCSAAPIRGLMQLGESVYPRVRRLTRGYIPSPLNRGCNLRFWNY